MNEITFNNEDIFLKYRKLLPAAEKYTYLNSAGCGPLATPILDKMVSVFSYMAEEGQVNVKVHDEVRDSLDVIRYDVAKFINAEPEEIFFVRCIAEGLNTISHMFSWNNGDGILISNQENPASILPFFTMETYTPIRTKVFNGLGDKEQIIEQFSKAASKEIKMAVMSHVFHTTGTALPAKEICNIAKERRIITVLDGAQASGNIPIDVKEIDCDFYLLSCHKWLCGPEGIAAVYIRKELIEKVLVPFGGVGIQDDFDFTNHRILYKKGAKRFEYGGRHTPMYSAFSESIGLANEIGLDIIFEKKYLLHKYCRKQFENKIPQIKIISPDDDRLVTGIFSFVIPGANHREVVKKAWEEEQMIIQWRTIDLNTKEEGIRVSLNWFVTPSEVDKLVSFVERIWREANE